MIFRLSHKLAKKLKVAPLSPIPADPNPFVDWSGHLFTADRTQYVILTNTFSLYSMVMHGGRIADDGQFVERALSSVQEFMVSDGLEFMFRRFIAPSSGTVRFASALNRSVTGSMNDLIDEAQMRLTEYDLSPFDTSFNLNEMPMSYLDYRTPRETFKALNAEQPTTEGGDE
jgi:hypothetical protein